MESRKDGMKQVASAAQGRAVRHYGMDWLRIGAFGILIFYHSAMVFSPWDWVVKAEPRYLWLAPLMVVLTPWRLALLFAVAGFASRMLFERFRSESKGSCAAGAGLFAISRAKRLLVPLAFGMLFIVPVEMWVRVAINGYPNGYLHFWTSDYWRIGVYFGRLFPSWQHLWFVAYLAVYSFLLAFALRQKGAAVLVALDRASLWLSHGMRIVWAPILLVATLRLSLLFVVEDKQGLFRDWAGHAQYLPIFLFGFTLARADHLWPVIARCWKAALLLALLAAGPVIWVEMHWPGSLYPPHLIMAVDRALRVILGWGVILTLLHVANRYWQRDHRWRRKLSEAVFPFYIVHHTALIALAWYILPLHLQPMLTYVLLVVGMLSACLLVYLVSTRIDWVRPLIGLGPRRRSAENHTS